MLRNIGFVIGGALLAVCGGWVFVVRVEGASGYERMTLLLTLSLVFVGSMQAYVYMLQARLMHASLLETKKSADAAVDAADAAKKAVQSNRAIEAPIFYVHPHRPPGIGVKAAEMSEIISLSFSYTITNHGRSPAWIREQRVAAQLVNREVVPEDLAGPHPIRIWLQRP
jgi:hypothetical protein